MDKMLCYFWIMQQCLTHACVDETQFPVNGKYMHTTVINMYLHNSIGPETP